LSTLEKLTNKSINKITASSFTKWLDTYFEIKTDITNRIQNTRAKDYANPFRKMVYQNEAEMNAVVGALKDNGFIKDQQKALTELADKLKEIKTQLKQK
jgi:23S rRNA maturation mini-RNase III